MGHYDLIVVGSGPGGASLARLNDASFFPSVGAVNPTSTIIANALRVAEHMKGRLRS